MTVVVPKKSDKKRAPLTSSALSDNYVRSVLIFSTPAKGLLSFSIRQMVMLKQTIDNQIAIKTFGDL